MERSEGTAWPWLARPESRRARDWRRGPARARKGLTRSRSALRRMVPWPPASRSSARRRRNLPRDRPCPAKPQCLRQERRRSCRTRQRLRSHQAHRLYQASHLKNPGPAVPSARPAQQNSQDLRPARQENQAQRNLRQQRERCVVEEADQRGHDGSSWSATTWVDVRTFVVKMDQTTVGPVSHSLRSGRGSGGPRGCPFAASRRVGGASWNSAAFGPPCCSTGSMVTTCSRAASSEKMPTPPVRHWTSLFRRSDGWWSGSGASG